MTYEIQQDNPEVIGMLAKDLELIPVTLKSSKIEYFAKGNVARIQSKHKASDDIQIAATSGNRREYKGSGYEKFQKMKQEKGL